MTTPPNVIPQEYTLEAIKTRVVREFLNVIILIEMAKRDSISGYDIIDLVTQKFSEPMSPGTVYSTLYAIERKASFTVKATEEKPCINSQKKAKQQWKQSAAPKPC